MQKQLKGHATIQFKGLPKNGSLMQIDLQQPMNITIMQNCDGKSSKHIIKRKCFYLSLPNLFKKEQSVKLELSFEGNPREAVNPPWDGGWIWTKDEKADHG